MIYAIQNRPEVGPKRPVKIRDMETGKTVATSTTLDKATADVQRRHEGKKK
jgi:hypothetical protein